MRAVRGASTGAEERKIVSALLAPEDDDTDGAEWDIVHDIGSDTMGLTPGMDALLEMRNGYIDEEMYCGMDADVVDSVWRDDLDLLPPWLANHAVTCWLEYGILVA